MEQQPSPTGAPRFRHPAPPCHPSPSALGLARAGWHWVDAPVLYPSVAQELGLTLDDPGAIVKWLQAH